MDTKRRIRIEQLQPGVFIQLEDGWLDHPFFFSKFKLKNWNQVEILSKIGVKEVSWVPEKSDCWPIEMEAPGTTEPQPAAKVNDDPYVELLWRIKKERVERLKQKHESLRQCTQRYDVIMKSVPNLMDQMLKGSKEALSSFKIAVEGMVDTLLGDTDAIVHLINIKGKEENIYHHSMNVSVLALMLGKKAKLSPPEMNDLGLGALFHDLGKSRIDKKVLKKKGALTKAESAIMQLHPRYGADILSKSGIREGVLRIVLEHHEQCNAQGYPAGLDKEKISKLARIVNIVNCYDNLCNNPDQELYMTPYEALSHMYTRWQHQIDIDLFSIFIRSMGIYPPGTVVRLSNGEMGIVISINPENPLRPSLLLYDTNIPKDEALIYDMEDDVDITIEKSIRADALAEEVRLYLSPARRVTYFMEKGISKGN
jgi:putative nucleotidyltransferase with HDIG domain